MLRDAFEPWHLVILAIVLMALFGSARMPDMARSVGRSMRVFKSEMGALRTGESLDDAEPTTQTQKEPGTDDQ